MLTFYSLYCGVRSALTSPSCEKSTATLCSLETNFLELITCQSSWRTEDETRAVPPLEEIIERYLEVLQRPFFDPNDLPSYNIPTDELEKTLNSLTNPLRTSRSLSIFEKDIAKKFSGGMSGRKKIRRAKPRLL